MRSTSSTRCRGGEPVNQLHIEVDDRCFKLLALRQPVAADLRAIIAAVKINTDLERVGDLAVNIAEAARRYWSDRR
ncbi:MAG: PhoU domain-containing protein [Vicinamibacterales bacterium]